jgi:hypothetical protein
MRIRCLALSLSLAMILVLTGCAKKETPAVMVLKGYPLDHPKGLIAQSDQQIGVGIDREVFTEGEGSLRISKTEMTAQPTTIRLFETGDLEVEEARLIYQAKLRTEEVEGKVYLEMWCHFPGRGEFFSRGLETPLSGTVDWTILETPFLLKKGEDPDNIRLNLVIDGTGTAWIDDIRLQREPLQ